MFAHWLEEVDGQRRVVFGVSQIDQRPRQITPSLFNVNLLFGFQIQNCRFIF